MAYSSHTARLSVRCSIYLWWIRIGLAGFFWIKMEHRTEFNGGDMVYRIIVFFRHTVETGLVKDFGRQWIYSFSSNNAL